MQASNGSQPPTADERWRELLRQLGVPSQPHVYVLGCFARHVTFYSQQVRALNLIDALCNTGELRENAAVGVVGAGLSGLTASAGALARGIDVHLFEKSGDPAAMPGRMPLQTNCDERWIEPFIYDWPGIGQSTRRAAGLPLLDWTADTADSVRAEVLKRFGALGQSQRARIAFHECEVDESMIRREAGRIVIARSGGHDVKVDALILAVGFGVEDPQHTPARYWTNDGLGGNEAEDKCFLVSGMGDGGLTDVMRLCIADFRHRDVLDAFRDESSAIGERLESAALRRDEDLWRVFLDEASRLNIVPDLAAQRLAARRIEVYLAGSPERLLGLQASASILNRLIVAWLFVNGRFTMIDARVRTPVSSDGRRCVVEFVAADGGAETNPRTWIWRDGAAQSGLAAPHEFDEVVIRHGPGRVDASLGATVQPLRDRFPLYWSASASTRSEWLEKPHWNDWSRRPQWDADAFGGAGAPPSDPADGPGRLFAVVEHPGTNGFVARAVRTAMQLVHKDEPGSAPRPSLVALDASLECETPQRFGRAVRTLCRADVAVFDLTDVEERSESLVLLGIRAVARRGVTIVTARFSDPEREPHEADAGFAVPPMPFLLQDVAVCGWGEEEKFTPRVKRAIEEGLHRAARLGPIYRDLPAYDEVRQLGPDAEDHRPQGPDDVVLFLSPFDAGHRKKRGSWLRSRVLGAGGSKGRGIYIIESASPERTSSKLYGAIRRTQFCIVDWTQRRPNVFFEFGVRLAASPQPAVCVIHRSEAWAAAPDTTPAQGLMALFRPLVYDDLAKPADVDAFEDELSRRRAVLGRPDVAASWPRNGALLSPDFVYREVRAATPIDSEDWARPVWEELDRSARQMIGPNPTLHPDPPVLFADLGQYRTRARQNAADRLLAAWYFLDRRHGLQRRLAESGEFDFDADTTRAWIAAGNTIIKLLEYDERAEYVDMREQVKGALRQINRLRKQRNP